MNESTPSAIDQQETGNTCMKWICVQPALAALNQGPTLRKVLGFLVQLGAVVLAFRFFVGWCRMWPIIKHASFLEGLGFVVFLLGLLYGGFLALQTMFVRGGNIRELPESDYVVSPIVGLLAAMLGEMAFFFFAVMSLPAMVGVWCGSRGGAGLPVLWQSYSGNAFVNGISLFLSCWLTGLFSLVVTRWIKEWTLAVVQIAQDVHAIRGK